MSVPLTKEFVSLYMLIVLPINRSECDDKFAVSPWFTSPYTGEKVYFIICLSHQVHVLGKRVQYNICKQL